MRFEPAPSALEQLRKDWYQQRVEGIHRKVSAYDVLRRNGVQLDGSDGRELQFSCTFHGVDRKPSARVYPESARGPSHAWCYVCQERWDAISLWMKFHNVTFSQALAELERSYGVSPPPMPDGMTAARVARVDPDLETFKTLFAACENRLISAKLAYAQLDDLRGYVTAGSVLDKLYSKVMAHRMPAKKANEVLQQLIEKIGLKMRSSSI